jgi:hypothetical protein
MIFGVVFMRRRIPLEVFNDFEDAGRFRGRVVYYEFKLGSVLEDNGASHEALDAFPFLLEEGQGAFALNVRPDNSDENDGRMEIVRDPNFVDGDDAHFGDRQFPANDFADLSFQ